MGASGTERRTQTILNLVQQGKTYAEIGSQFSLTRQRIHQIASEAGISRGQNQMRAELKDARLNIRLSKRLKHDLEKLFEGDPREYRGLSDYISTLLDEFVKKKKSEPPER
jgi:hypothetical protein